jgi:hypothetical protein
MDISSETRRMVERWCLRYGSPPCATGSVGHWVQLTSHRPWHWLANSFQLGAGFADPHHTTALGAGRVFIEDKFDQLTTAKRSAKRYGNFSLGEVT